MTLETSPYDSAEYLDSEEAIAEYLAATGEDGSPQKIAPALGLVARARGVTDLARRAGPSRQALYKALGGQGNPEFATIVKVAEALGFRLSLVPAGKGDRDAA